MAFSFRTKKGKNVTLLNPSEKGRKYADELRLGFKVTNDGEYKADKDGKYLLLDKAQKSYRAGYLDAQKDSARAYKARQKKKA